MLFLPKCEIRPLDEGIAAYCHSYLIKATSSGMWPMDVCICICWAAPKPSHCRESACNLYRQREREREKKVKPVMRRSFDKSYLRTIKNLMQSEAKQCCCNGRNVANPRTFSMICPSQHIPIVIREMAIHRMSFVASRASRTREF